MANSSTRCSTPRSVQRPAGRPPPDQRQLQAAPPGQQLDHLAPTATSCSTPRPVQRPPARQGAARRDRWGRQQFDQHRLQPGRANSSTNCSTPQPARLPPARPAGADGRQIRPATAMALPARQAAARHGRRCEHQLHQAQPAAAGAVASSSTSASCWPACPPARPLGADGQQLHQLQHAMAGAAASCRHNRSPSTFPTASR